MSDSVPRGHFVSRAGTFMAGADEILVTVRGAGAHGSRPHTGKDPIPVACEMVLALQTLVTRKFDIYDPVVITVGAFHAGTASNIIPDDAAFHVTMRSFSRESRAKLLADGRESAQRTGLGLRHDGVDITYKEQYPPTVNHAADVDFLEEVVREVHGEERFSRIPNPNPGAEDFSRAAGGGAGHVRVPRRVRRGRLTTAPSQPQPAGRLRRLSARRRCGAAGRAGRPAARTRLRLKLESHVGNDKNPRRPKPTGVPRT